ncbi:MAG: ABC transporter permease [Acidobacteriota bacterium]
MTDPGSRTRGRPWLGVTREYAAQALETVRAHKMRSGLVILGVAIGVTTLMAMVSILSGLSGKIESDIRSSDNVVVHLAKFDFLGGGVDPELLRARPDLKPSDWDAIRQGVASVQLVDFHQQAEGGRLYLAHFKDKRSRPLQVSGTSLDFPRIFAIPLAVGRFFTEDELARNRRVCVLGKGPLEDLFPHVDPVGKKVRVHGQLYQVVGGFKGRESLFGAFADNFAIIPFTAFRKDFARKNRDQILIPMVPAAGSSVEDVINDVRGLMRGRHKLRPAQDDDFALVPSDRIQTFVQDVTGPVGLALTVIASIGLMVGGIGVMAIMLVSVTERTREIGIRKAVGATRLEILGQFLTEAMVLTGLGGLLGTASGLGVARLITWVTGFPSSVPVAWTLAAVLVSAGIGLLFGMYPAARAAALDPVDAIRQE